MLVLILKQSNRLFLGERALVHLLLVTYIFARPYFCTCIGALGELLRLIVATPEGFVYLSNSFSRLQVHQRWEHPFFFSDNTFTTTIQVDTMLLLLHLYKILCHSFTFNYLSR